MKNSTSVAGTALAMPLSTNTAISRLNGAWRQGCSRSSRKGRTGLTSAGGGGVLRFQAQQPSASVTANTATHSPQPRKLGKTDASTDATTGTLTSGAAFIFVGAKLTVGASQAAGTYTGIVKVTVAYN